MANQDDWETDPDFVNDLTEKQSRWGSKTVQGSGLQGHVDMESIRKEVIQKDKEKVAAHESSKSSYGYGGKFGVMSDRMDKTAESWDYKGVTDKHSSTKDYSYGFGGKYGVQKDRQDKCALDWEHRDKLAVHESQKAVTVDAKGKVSHDWLHQKPVELPKRAPVQLPIRTVDSHENVEDDLQNSEVERRKMSAQTLADELKHCKASALREKFEKLAIEQKNSAVSRPKLPDIHNSIKNDAQAIVTKAPGVEEHVANGEQSNDEDEWNDNFVKNVRVQPERNESQSTAFDSVESEPPVRVEQIVNGQEGVTAEEMGEEPVQSHPLGEPEHPMADTGIKAVALYDYQAGDTDEISFEPDDIISNIDMVDTDWWRGYCRGQYGLFPANYVELNP